MKYHQDEVSSSKGPDETVVWLFRNDGTEVVCRGSETSTVGGASGRAGVDVGQIPRSDHGRVEINGLADGSEDSPSDAYSTRATAGSYDTRNVEDSDQACALAVWRAKFFVGKGVGLEDWMIEYVADGLGWEMPEFEIYIGKVAGDNNRMCEDERDRFIKFSIGKDGRAVFSVGWAGFAAASRIETGSVVSFSFSNGESELDIAIEVLRQ